MGGRLRVGMSPRRGGRDPRRGGIARDATAGDRGVGSRGRERTSRLGDEARGGAQWVSADGTDRSSSDSEVTRHAESSSSAWRTRAASSTESCRKRKWSGHGRESIWCAGWISSDRPSPGRFGTSRRPSRPPRFRPSSRPARTPTTPSSPRLSRVPHEEAPGTRAPRRATADRTAMPAVAHEPAGRRLRVALRSAADVRYLRLRSYASVGPPASFQAVYPPSTWHTRSRPMRCATSVARAERQSRLQ